MWFVTAQVACSERTAFASLRVRATFPLGDLLHGARTARDGEPSPVAPRPSALLRKTTPCAGARSRACLPGRRCTRPRMLMRWRPSAPRRLRYEAHVGSLGATALALLSPGGHFGLVQLPPASGLVGSAARLRRCWPVQTQSAVASSCAAQIDAQNGQRRGARDACVLLTSVILQQYSCFAVAPAGGA